MKDAQSMGREQDMRNNDTKQQRPLLLITRKRTLELHSAGTGVFGGVGEHATSAPRAPYKHTDLLVLSDWSDQIR